MASNASIAATDALTRPVPRAAKRSLYFVWVSIAICLIAVVGFTPTYWLQVPAGTFIGRPIVHLHAVMFTLWLLLLLSQAILAARGKIKNHRAWGMAGISLATMMALLGIATAVGAMRSHLGKGFDENERALLVVPLSQILMFAGFFAAAMVSINRSAWHGRWILLATLAMTQAAFVNVWFLVTTGTGPGLRPGLAMPRPHVAINMPNIFADFLLLAVILFDWRRCRRLHPAWLIGLAVIFVIQLGRIPLSASPTWQSFAAALANFS